MIEPSPKKVKFDDEFLTEDEVTDYEQQPTNLRKEERRRERMIYPDLYNTSSFTKDDILYELVRVLIRYKEIINRRDC